MPAPKKDLQGMRFGNLVAMERVIDKAPTKWLCKCDCGETTVVSTKNLKTTKSCGCLNHKPKYLKHGQARSRLYNIYYSMKTRCYNANDKHYPRYGSRGIRICDDWLDDFTNFYKWAIKNGYDDSLSIDRIDNDKGYNPDNCRWATRSQQQRNKSKLKMRREEIIDVILTSHWEEDTKKSAYNLERFQDNDFKYLVGKNLRNEGFFIIWDGEKSVGQLDINVLKTIANEAKLGSVKPPYHVYARYQLYQSPNVMFYQIPDKILAHLQ